MLQELLTFNNLLEGEISQVYKVGLSERDRTFLILLNLVMSMKVVKILRASVYILVFFVVIFCSYLKDYNQLEQ